MSDFWELLEDPPAGCDAVADLWSWSTNYDAGKGPATLFLDLIGYSADEFGEPLYDMKNASLGYVELGKLADALTAYSDRPHDVRAFVGRVVERGVGTVSRRYSLTMYVEVEADDEGDAQESGFIAAENLLKLSWVTHVDFGPIDEAGE